MFRITCVAKSTVRRFSSVNIAGNLPKADVLSRVIGVVSSVRSAPTTIPSNAYFAADLNFDSMQRGKLMEKFQEEFCVTFPAGKVNAYPSIESVVDYFSSHPKSR